MLFRSVPVRSSTSGRLMPPARSRWRIAVLIPSIEICNNKPQSVPLNTISSLCRYLQPTAYQRKCDIGKWPRMNRPRKPTQAEIGTNWSARRTATDAKAKTEGQLPHHHYHELWVATWRYLQHTWYHRKYAIGKLRRMHRPQKRSNFNNLNKLVGKANCNRCQGYNQRPTPTPPLPRTAGRNVNLRSTHSNHI